MAAAGAAAAPAAPAATQYVSDDLVLGVYAQPNPSAQRLATLHSGARVETLAGDAEFTQVRLADGTTGWVRTSYLTPAEPAAARVKQLEEELDRARATTPALAEAAARSELEGLKLELAEKQSLLDAAHGASPAQPAARISPLQAAALILAAVCGFALGYATLARRVRRKFGGLKVY